MRQILFTLFLGLVISTSLKAQSEQDTSKIQFVQFSGVVLNDSLGPIPYAYIYEKSSQRGTMTDYYGYFSFVAEVGDTIIFSSVQYKKATLVIPDTLTDFRFSFIQMLQQETTQLPEKEIYPWPSKDEFVDAFVNLDLATNSYDLARQNLKRQELAAQARGVTNDSYLSYKDAQRQELQKIYYAGQAPPNNLLNPIAWAKFINAWKNGDLKRE